MVDIRVNELLGLDVLHFAVQANKTFTGNDRKIHEFEIPGVIDYCVIDMPDGNDPWVREKFQRNAIMRLLSMFPPKDDDIIIISDADEIVRADAIHKFAHMGHTDFAALEMDSFFYYLNCKADAKWTSPKIMRYSHLKKFSPEEVRGMGWDHTIKNAGWHFSYMGGVEAIKKKLGSFSHSEFNTPEFIARIDRKFEIGESLFGDDLWKFVPLDNTFPAYLIANQEKFKHLIKQL